MPRSDHPFAENPPAQAEIAEAFDWYEDKSYGLGGDFLRVIAAAAEQLSRTPEAFAPTHAGFRRLRLQRLPPPDMPDDEILKRLLAH